MKGVQLQTATATVQPHRNSNNHTRNHNHRNGHHQSDKEEDGVEDGNHVALLPATNHHNNNNAVVYKNVEVELEPEEEEHDRGAWSSKMDFMMSCVGYAVGLGNIWRFPYLCYKNGGGAFLIPYFVCLIFSGIPVFLLETTLGQLLGRGYLSIWQICPILKGVGYSSLILLLWMNTYYIVVIAWSLYYLVHSIRLELPWSSCSHPFNTPSCRSDRDLQHICSDWVYHLRFGNTSTDPHPGLDWLNFSNLSVAEVVERIHTERANSNITDFAVSDDQLSPDMLANCTEMMVGNFTSPVMEYWHLHVLKTSPSIDTIGSIHIGMALCLVIAWVICYYSMYKGIQMSGKIIYVTALFPYFCLFILFLRGITLEGAMTGLKYYFKPNMDRILDPNVWNDAATQIFYSYGLGVGAWITLSSYNKYNNNVLRDTIIISVINGLTAVFSGAIVFCIVGFMAHQENKPIDKVAASGSGLTFIAYPSATLKMPYVQLWSVLFFIMMILLGLGSQFVQLESFFTGFIDEFPGVLRNRRTMFITYICALSSIIGMIFVTDSGIYWFELFNTYAASGFALLYLVFFEVIAVIWFYGDANFVPKIEKMLGRKISKFWIICWKYISPITSILIFVFSLIKYQPPTYLDTEYPTWAIGVGWILAVSSMICVPVYAIVIFVVTPGTFTERWDKLVKPNYDAIDQIVRDRAATVLVSAKQLKLKSNNI